MVEINEGEAGMRPYNRWLFNEHLELVLTISSLYKTLPAVNLLDVLNLHFPKPVPPDELISVLNMPPWSKYDIDSLAEDFRLLFTRLPGTAVDEVQPQETPVIDENPRPV